MNDENDHVTHTENLNHETYTAEAEYGDQISNQWSLKLKKINPLYKAKQFVKEKSSPPIDIKTDLLLKNDGRAFITFNVSYLKKYSISIINDSPNLISYIVEISPNNLNFMPYTSSKEIEPSQVGYFSSHDYVKYIRVMITGKSASSVIVFLQGMK